MSELSRSLVDAAAEAMRLERVRILRETGCSASPEQESAAGVAAVLETLAAKADSFNEDLRLHKHQREALRRLAVEAREETAR